MQHIGYFLASVAQMSSLDWEMYQVLPVNLEMVPRKGTPFCFARHKAWHGWGQKGQVVNPGEANLGQKSLLWTWRQAKLSLCPLEAKGLCGLVGTVQRPLSRFQAESSPERFCLACGGRGV